MLNSLSIAHFHQDSLTSEEVRQNLEEEKNSSEFFDLEGRLTPPFSISKSWRTSSISEEVRQNFEEEKIFARKSSTSAAAFIIISKKMVKPHP